MPLRRAAKALIRRKSDGKYLIVWSSEWEENPRRSHQPDLPGGIVEDGETMEQGLNREILEEVGVDVSHINSQLGYAFTYDHGQNDSIFLAYLTEIDFDPEIKLSWEHERYEWLTADEVMALEIREPYPTILKSMQKSGLLV